MAISKKMSLEDRVAEAYGPQATKPEETSSQSAEQLALRRIVMGPAKGKPEQIQEAFSVLENEFASGSMPVSRQEALFSLAICRPKAVELKHLGEEDKRRLNKLALLALTHPESEINWQQPLATTYERLHLDSAARHAMYHHEDAVKAVIQEREGPSILTWVLSYPALRKALENRGGVPLRALGADPARALLAASIPNNHKDEDCKNFLAELDYFGVSDKESPSKSNSTPLLILILARIAESHNVAMSQDWLNVLKKADSLPWLRFDHKSAIWRGAHPLWALARVVTHINNQCQGWPDAAAAFVRMGYGPNGERPEGKEFKMNDDSNLFAKQNPNALWAMLSAQLPLVEMGEVYAVLLRNGADWKEKSQGHDDPEPVSLLAKLNKKAKTAAANTAERAAIENAFEQIARVGGDPLDALPPPSRKVLAPGRIQQMVDARLEQRALLQTISDADIQEGLALLAESRAKKALEKAAEEALVAQSESGSPAPQARPRGNRL